VHCSLIFVPNVKKRQQMCREGFPPTVNPPTFCLVPVPSATECASNTSQAWTLALRTRRCNLKVESKNWNWNCTRRGDMSTVLVKVKQFWKRMNRTVEETSETNGASMEVCFCRRVCIRRMTGACMYRVFNLRVCGLALCCTLRRNDVGCVCVRI